MYSQLIEDNDPDAVEKSEKRALGHGNRAMLLVFPYNVPTQTITVIREAGIVDGVAWQPLLRRRKKL